MARDGGPSSRGPTSVLGILPNDFRTGIKRTYSGLGGPAAGGFVKRGSDIPPDIRPDYRAERRRGSVSTSLSKLVTDHRSGGAADQGSGKLIRTHGVAAGEQQRQWQAYAKAGDMGANDQGVPGHF